MFQELLMPSKMIFTFKSNAILLGFCLDFTIMSPDYMPKIVIFLEFQLNFFFFLDKEERQIHRKIGCIY